MHLVFVDDSGQANPSRDGMRPLVATGGVIVPGDLVGWLETALDEACASYGFPDGAEFKWSPSGGDWMHDSLVGDGRAAFYSTVLSRAAEAGVVALVMISDTETGPFMNGAASPAFDTMAIFLERVHNHMQSIGSTAVVVADRPGGGRAQETELLRNSQSLLSSGTQFVDLSRIPINVLTTGSDLVRGLQLADLVTGCTTAFVAGENVYSPSVFGGILPMVRRDYECYGGRGIKIHPDYRYANLYHWLFGDSHFVRFQMGVPMPLNRPYRDGPDKY